MVISDRKRTCFVVMPFGEKTDTDGQDIDFDDIYRFFFKKAVEDLGIECIRCDEIEEAGSIHEKMFEHIYQSDVVVVDITSSNPNVYYELGVRHALAKGVTVLIRRKGTNIPFNIQGLQVVEYDQAKFGSIERAKARIHQIIKNGLNMRISDSPVHAILDLNIEPEGKPIGETKFYEFQLAGTDDTIVGLVTGDIQNVTKGIDVWVNSENTNMQMARPFENSISGIIRYHGAEKANGHVKDTIAEALAAKMKCRVSVAAAEVVVTTSGAMRKSHNVQRIFHAAAVVGQVGKGYTPIADVAQCVTNALSASDDSPDDCAGCELKSILFPLLGVRLGGRRGHEDEDRVKALFDAAINYLVRSPGCSFKKVYFLNYTDKDFDVCHALLKADARLKPLSVNPPAAGVPAAEIPVSRTSASPASSFSSGDRTVLTSPAASSNAAPEPTRAVPPARSNHSATRRKRPKSRPS
jgi:hypothetical protein